MAASQLEGNKEEFLFEGKNLKCKKELLGGFGFVYGGYWYDKDLSVDQPTSGKPTHMKKEAVIRRIHKNNVLDGWEDKAKEFIKSPSQFLLNIFACEKSIDDWRYFAVEPYSFTLYHYCNGQYEGPALPSEPQVINQMISGIKYLRSEGKAHGDLNPLNVIITQDQRIKLSDFGLSKFSYTKCPSIDLSIRIPEICKRKYWLRVRPDNETNAELIRNPLENVRPKQKDDLFAAGCLIFYFLTKDHPFGDFKSIEENMTNKNPINLTKMKEEHAQLYKKPIENLIGQPDNDEWWSHAIRTFKDALELKIDEAKVLGEGSYGKVYEGKYEGVPVAVKEIKKNSSYNRLFEREIKEHIKLDHDNVLKLLKVCHSNDHLHWHLVLDLCAGTLTDYCEKKKEIPQLPTNGVVLYQITNGVNYVHSQNLIHRDIKPDNILISITQPVQMKVADLGLAKKITDKGCYSLSAIRGTPLYRAPELLEKSESGPFSDETVQTDTFSTGCVFFYFLTRGFHPFHDREKVDSGNWPQVREKIIKNKPIGLENRKKSLSCPFYDLISKMIAPKDQRIELPEVIKILATELSATRVFKKVVSPIVCSCSCVLCSCFHPTEPVLACATNEKLFLLSAANWSIPFSNWKKQSETKLHLGHFVNIDQMKWNVDGTLLAELVFYFKPFVIVWSYPSCEILFEQDLLGFHAILEWNPFTPKVLSVIATSSIESIRSNRSIRIDSIAVYVFHCYPYDERKLFQSCFNRKKAVRALDHVQWISKNQVALGSFFDAVEIYEMNESNFIFRLIKRYDTFIITRQYFSKYPEIYMSLSPAPFLWNERTNCFAAFCNDKKLKIWSIEGDEPIYSLKIDKTINYLAWRPNGEKTNDEEKDAARKSSSNFLLACGLDNGNILIWTPLKETQKKILSGHSTLIYLLSFSPNGKFLASGDKDNKLIIWSTETWETVFIGKGFLFHFFSSWMSSSADNPEYKFICRGSGLKTGVMAVEYAVGQTTTIIKESKNIPSEDDRQSEKKETRGQWSIGSSGDLK